LRRPISFSSRKNLAALLLFWSLALVEFYEDKFMKSLLWCYLVVVNIIGAAAAPSKAPICLWWLLLCALPCSSADTSFFRAGGTHAYCSSYCRAVHALGAAPRSRCPRRSNRTFSCTA
jgi:hypothetical protein